MAQAHEIPKLTGLEPTYSNQGTIKYDAPAIGPSVLNEAVSKAMLEVVRLKKADNNAFAKYRYTSVDDFKDALRPILAENGLVAHMSETACEMFEGKTADKSNVKFAFAITLEHTSGEKAAPENVTVILPFVGAQTTGQARSYALKEWLKSRFLASSGDSEDADAHDTDEELGKAEARPLYIELQEELRVAAQKGRAEMEAWADGRRPSLEVMPKDWRLKLKAQYREGLAGKAPKGTPAEDLNDDDSGFVPDVDPNETLDRQFQETMREDGK